MVPLHPRYIDDGQPGGRSVVLPIVEWEQVLEDLEELDDIRSYDAATSEPDESLPFDQAVREIREQYDA